MKSPLLLIAILISCLFACEKEALSDSLSAAEQPVVEAYLAVGQSVEVKISRQLPPDGTSADLPITNLAPVILVDDETFPLTETTPGTYQADDELMIVSGQTYSLAFTYQGQNVTATTEVPARPINYQSSATSLTFETSTFPPSFPDPVELSWDNPTNNYFQVKVENTEDDPDFLSFGGGEEGAERPVILSTPIQSDNYELTIREFQYSGMHRIVLAQVTTDYVVLAQETANADEQNPTSPYTNIIGGTGIFTGIGTDTLFVDVRD